MSVSGTDVAKVDIICIIKSLDVGGSTLKNELQATFTPFFLLP